MAKSLKLLFLTGLSMTAFATNSLLCRLALKQTGIDAASFTSIRLISGAVTLWLIVQLRGRISKAAGDWVSALFLFAYAAGFSFAYVSLSATTGALLLFGAVQSTMIGYGLWQGERLNKRQSFGLLLALSGLISLLLPGFVVSSIPAVILMLTAGVAWGIYSLRGKQAVDPLRATLGNFCRAVIFTVLLSLTLLHNVSLDSSGILVAILSGTLASGVGYAIWYTALQELNAIHSATVQLSVPVITAVAGWMLLGEALSLRLIGVSIAILGGIALVIVEKPQKTRTDR
jgi:drug/metabolite transporter (DMT)-like permease